MHLENYSEVFLYYIDELLHLSYDKYRIVKNIRIVLFSFILKVIKLVF